MVRNKQIGYSSPAFGSLATKNIAGFFLCHSFCQLSVVSSLCTVVVDWVSVYDSGIQNVSLLIIYVWDDCYVKVNV